MSICASRFVKDVIGIEISPESALNARTNAKLNGADNVTIYAGAVRYVLSKIRSDGKHSVPDVVFVDPPRAGLDPLTIKLLLEQNPPRIVYISCNPKTQAVDIKCFVQQGYRLMALQPVEQFPQVAHVENIALLVRHDVKC